jgi:outer membrane protein assembly factor BamC
MIVYRFVIAAVVPLFVLSGCSYIKGKDEPDYKSASTTSVLEVPPDLTSPNRDETYVLPQDERVSARATEQAVDPATAAAATVAVLPDHPDMRLEHDGPMSWLVVSATPEELWPRLEKFWPGQGLVLKKSNPQLGTMETDWAERNLNVEEGSLQNLFSTAGGIFSKITDSGMRDKFLLRMTEEAEETNIFITHRGAEEIPISDVETRWISRPNDLHLESQILVQLMVYLGEEEKVAEQMVAATGSKPPVSQVVEYDNGPALKIEGEERYIWRRMGNVLDHSGLVVDDQDRKRGIYYVTYLGDGAEKGFLTSIFGVGSSGPLDLEEQYQIRLLRDGDYTYATAHDKEGKRLVKEGAQGALELISEHFN